MRSRKGVILILSYFLIALLIIAVAAIILRNISEMAVATNSSDRIKAFNLAEGGLNKAKVELRYDFINDTDDPGWSDGEINGIPCGPDTENFYTLYETTTLGLGTFRVELKNIPGETGRIIVRSSGTFNNSTRTIEATLSARNISPWNNVIFGGAGTGGSLIKGNVDIRGSVHLLGSGLSDTDSAIDMSGTAVIGNNYENIPTQLEDRIPSCPTITLNNETVETLNTELRIRQGQASLNGTGTVGEQNEAGNPYKETVDGTYVTDGFSGDKGTDNVYSDNGSDNVYDLGNEVQFPSLSEPYLEYPTYQDYLYANALVISEASQLNELANITPDSNFSYSDINGSISMDGAGNLNISGIVYIDGASDLNMNKSGPNRTINYTGTGSILATGDVNINVNLLTVGTNSFPNNVLGVMTPNEINFNQANIDVMGAFFAENQITSTKQTNVAGTFVSNYLDMGTDVPSVFQVPSLAENLPDGLIANVPIWYVKTLSWREIIE